MRHLGALLLLLTLAATAGAASIPWLMVGDSTNDRVMLFDRADGSLLNADWLTDTGAVGWAFSTPKEARVVAGEIWVADQVEDAIHRFSPGLAYLGSITSHHMVGVALDNIRGFGEDGSQVYVSVYSLATPAARGVVVYDTAGNSTGFLPGTGSYFDAEPFQGDLLVSDTLGDAVERWSTGGSLIGDFASSLGYPEQIEILEDGSVLVGNAIDAPGVVGIHHFNPDGTLRRFIDTETYGITRGAYLLGNGNYLIGTSSGVYIYDVGTTGFSAVMSGVGAQYVTPYTRIIPEPGTVATGLLGMAVVAGLALRRRRRAG